MGARLANISAYFNLPSTGLGKTLQGAETAIRAERSFVGDIGDDAIELLEEEKLLVSRPRLKD